VRIVRSLLIACLTAVFATGGSVAALAQERPPAAVSTCVGCHRLGSAPAQPYPSIAGQYEAYLIKQLKDFRAGRRLHRVMEARAAALKRTDIAVVAAYFSKQRAIAGKQADEKVAARGKVLYESGNPETGVPGCRGCHASTGDNASRYPRLEGQLVSYTTQQMSAFKFGQRTTDAGGVMRAIAARMSEDEVAAVAGYVAGLSR
jgi:cytochrome c553